MTKNNYLNSLYCNLFEILNIIINSIILVKANFKISKIESETNKDSSHPLGEEDGKAVSEKEFEDYVIKHGAAGSFMVFRSDRKKEDELGLDEL